MFLYSFLFVNNLWYENFFVFPIKYDFNSNLKVKIYLMNLFFAITVKIYSIEVNLLIPKILLTSVLILIPKYDRILKLHFINKFN